jgi:hypothetical protein
MSATEGFIDDVSKGLGKFCFKQVSPLIGFACRGFALLLLMLLTQMLLLRLWKKMSLLNDISQE